MSIHRVTISSTYFGSVCQNVVYCYNADGALTAAQIATEFYDNFVGHSALVGIQHLANSYVTFFQVKVENVSSPGDAPYLLAINRQGEVQGTTEASPTVCLVLQLRTATAGRHGHGRIYLPGTNPAFTNSGLVSSGGQSYIVQCLPALNARFCIGGSGPLYLVVHRKGTTGADDHPVTVLQIASRLGVQRRRSVGVGI